MTGTRPAFDLTEAQLCAVGATARRGTLGGIHTPEIVRDALTGDCERSAMPVAGLLAENNTPRIRFQTMGTVFDLGWPWAPSKGSW